MAFFLNRWHCYAEYAFLYLAIRLQAQDFHEVIVDEGKFLNQLSPDFIEIEGESIMHLHLILYSFILLWKTSCWLSKRVPKFLDFDVN